MAIRIWISNYQDLIEEVTVEYLERYEEKKLERLFDIIPEDNRINALIESSWAYNRIPAANEFIYAVDRNILTAVSFKLAKTMAALIGLETWNIKANTNNKFFSDDELKDIAKEIILTIDKRLI